MPSEGIPVNKEIITWARERAGFSLADAAAKFPHIKNWEIGSALPSYPQLEKMADEFKVPIAVFFFPAPPNVPPIRESFRTLPDTEFDSIPRRVVLLLRKAKAFQLNLSELFFGKNPASHRITHDLEFTPQTSVEKLATKVRDYLAITLDQQWAAKHSHIFTTPTAAEAELIAHIYAVPHFQQNIEAQKLLKGGRNADPFVIAKAAVDESTVVTMEQLRPNAAKIPNICEHFKVQWRSLEQFMEEQGWEF